MSEDNERSTIDREEQLEAYRRLLGEVKEKKLPEMTPDKKELVERILRLRKVKEDYSRSKRERIEAENLSFEAYEKLLALCDGDSDLVARLLGSRRPYPIKTEDEP
jgi:hypothetical protein